MAEKPVTHTGFKGEDHVKELAGRLLDARTKLADLADQAKGLKADIAELEKALAEAMTSGEWGSFTVWGHRYVQSTRRNVSSKPESRDQLIAHFDAENLPDMAPRTVNAQRLGKYVRELMDANGGQVPEDIAGLVTVFAQPVISITKV